MSNGSKEQELPPLAPTVDEYDQGRLHRGFRARVTTELICRECQLREANAQIATLASQVEELQEEVQGRKAQVSDLSDAVFERDERITSLAIQVEELNTQTAAGTSAIYVPKAQYDSKIARYEAELAALREGAKSVLKIAEEAYEAWDADKDMRAGKILRSLSGLLPGYKPDVDSARSRILDEKAER